MLDLGASPNYKDLKGLSPLYYCVTNSSEVVICELLLHDRSAVGATDLQGKARHISIDDWIKEFIKRK